MTESALTRNNVTIIGKGKQPVIFASGFGFDQKVWATIAESFEEDYQVILFDYVGFGNSDVTAYDPEKYRTISGYVEDVLEICNELDLVNAIFVGHSVGGMIGLLASIQQPATISTLVMIGSSPSFLNEPNYHGGFEKEELDALLELMEKNYFEWTTLIAETIMNGSNQPEMKTGIEEQFRFNAADITYEFAKVCFFTDYREYLQDNTVPTLLIHSHNDLFVPEEVSQYMKEKLPNSTISYLPTTGHCPHISHPKEILDTMKRFLNEQSKSVIKSTGALYGK
ncbi:hydrolase [Halalkalibacter wakoensis JCM 9140]|uniref:Hydrolase n=1 Tax=Halalkalibacter wakoensis JCM 9140 TaxID=1236970 RepID=W4Q3W9_9BACI|nr:alpha/beta hydrolase [Halalkalibacter wakoensis]GAE26781.1 hydrolase [Halalkalibacter wakoensis JCM 9140]